MANDTQKEYPNLLCYIKWKSLVNVKCICWAESKDPYTCGINRTKGAALACSLLSKAMVVGRENSLSFQVPPGKLYPQAALAPPTPLWCHSTLSEMQRGPRDSLKPDSKTKIHSVMKK